MKFIRSTTLAVALGLALSFTPAAQAQNPFPAGRYMMMDGFGYWEFAFKSDGTFTVSLNDLQPVVNQGRYAVTRDRVTFSDDSEVCAGRGDGDYAWQLDGAVLRMHVIKDRCVLWRFALTKGLTPITPDALSGRLLAGSYSGEVLAEDVPYFPNLKGHWSISIEKDGGFQIAHDDDVLWQGRHFVVGDWVRFIGDAETFPCFIKGSHDPYQQPETFVPGTMLTAVYRWRIVKGALRLETMYDWCHARRSVLMTPTWMER